MRLDLDWHCPIRSQLATYPVPRRISLLCQAQWTINGRVGTVLPENLAPSAVSSLESIASKPSELYQRVTASPKFLKAHPIFKRHVGPHRLLHGHTRQCTVQASTSNRHTPMPETGTKASPSAGKKRASSVCFRRLHPAGPNICLSMANCPLRPARGNRSRIETPCLMMKCAEGFTGGETISVADH